MRLSLCNEVLAHLSFEEQCRAAGAMGYTGLELAPFTLHADPSQLGERDARRFRDIAAGHGLAISSLHWLLVKPSGLSIATTDPAAYEATIDFLLRMIDFAAACGAEAMVHGSPAQRSPAPGQSAGEASQRCEAAWARIAPRAEAAGVRYCIEPLAPTATPVVNTLAEALAIVARIGSPALRTVLDLSAVAHSEAHSAADLLRRYLPDGSIAHVQLNDANGRGPGQGDTPVAPVLEQLKALRYRGWIAIEPFDYYPDPMSCARFCADHVRRLWSTSGGD